MPICQNSKQDKRIVHLSTRHAHRLPLHKFQSIVTYTTKNLLCLQAPRLTQIRTPCYLEFPKDVTALYISTWRSLWYHSQLIKVIVNSSSWSNKSWWLEHLSVKQNKDRRIRTHQKAFFLILDETALIGWSNYLILSASCEWWRSAFRSVPAQFWAGSKSTWSMYRFDFVLFSRQASKYVISCE